MLRSKAPAPVAAAAEQVALAGDATMTGREVPLAQCRLFDGLGAPQGMGAGRTFSRAKPRWWFDQVIERERELERAGRIIARCSEASIGSHWVRGAGTG